MKRKLSPNQRAARNIRHKMIMKYGGKCECCEENTIEFLTLDHAGGGGDDHRYKSKKYRLSTRNILHKLNKLGWPRVAEFDGTTYEFRLLCMNCNMSYGNYGYCPHQGFEAFLAKQEARDD